MAFKPRVVIAEVGKLRNPSSSRLEMRNQSSQVSMALHAIFYVHGFCVAFLRLVLFAIKAHSLLSGGLGSFDSD